MFWTRTLHQRSVFLSKGTHRLSPFQSETIDKEE